MDFTGSFRSWTVIPRLHQINVPTLMYSGEFDTSHEVTIEPLFEHIPRVKWLILPDAGHMAHLERPELAEKIFKLVARFLLQR